MIVPYTRFLSFLVNGLDKTYRTNLYSIKDDLEFRLDEYVLSQVHLAIVCHLLKRDLYLICRVYRFFVHGHEIDRADVMAVLRWFYSDMSGFYRNIARCNVLHGIKLRVTVPEDILASLGIDSEEVSFAREKQEVLLGLKKGEGKYEKYINLNYKDVQGLGHLFDGNPEQENRFVMSVILAHFSEREKYVKVVD